MGWGNLPWNDFEDLLRPERDSTQVRATSQNNNYF